MIAPSNYLLFSLSSPVLQYVILSGNYGTLLHFRVRDQYNTTVYDGPNNLPGQQESEVITSLLGYGKLSQFVMTLTLASADSI